MCGPRVLACWLFCDLWPSAPAYLRASGSLFVLFPGCHSPRVQMEEHVRAHVLGSSGDWGGFGAGDAGVPRAGAGVRTYACGAQVRRYGGTIANGTTARRHDGTTASGPLARCASSPALSSRSAAGSETAQTGPGQALSEENCVKDMTAAGWLARYRDNGSSRQDRGRRPAARRRPAPLFSAPRRGGRCRARRSAGEEHDGGATPHEACSLRQL